MGIFKKIKDIFYDEEIVEVPVKEEPKRENLSSEIKKPVIQEITPSSTEASSYIEREPQKNISSFSERELFKPEKTFDFPVFEEEVVKTRSKTNVLELQRELEERSMNSFRNNDYNNKEGTNLEKKETVFKPSPVISPIYGILDKNYKKEEIIEKKETKKILPNEMNYDYVRKKAYGTLEDELEDTLTKVNTKIIDDVNDLENEIEDLPKPSKNIEELLGEIEKNANVSIGDLEEKAKNKMLEEDSSEENLNNNFEVEKEEHKEIEVTDNTLEHDLFNLIDSMYEDKEE